MFDLGDGELVLVALCSRRGRAPTGRPRSRSRPGRRSATRPSRSRGRRVRAAHAGRGTAGSRRRSRPLTRRTAPPSNAHGSPCTTGTATRPCPPCHWERRARRSPCGAPRGPTAPRGRARCPRGRNPRARRLPRTNGASGVGRSTSALKFSVCPTKSTAKLRTRSPSSASIAADRAVIVDESSPPESSTQRGTSATSWRRTMSSSSSRTCATVASWSSLVRPRLQAPVAVPADAVGVDGDDRAGLDLVHARPHGVPRRLDEREHLSEPVGVDDAPRERVGEDRLGLGAEQHAVGGRVVVQRLDPHAVADHHELARTAVPDRRTRTCRSAARRVLCPSAHSRAAPPRCRWTC